MLSTLLMLVMSCEKETTITENEEEQGTENTETFSIEAVNLGLSVMWANCNVGANYPEGFGDLYEWRDNIPWGKKWRLPSLSEIKELHDKCTWVWTKQKEINGMLVTGPNGNSIFLPAAGCQDEKGIQFQDVVGTYWGDTYEGSTPIFTFGSTGSFINDGGNSIKRSIRPVSE